MGGERDQRGGGGVIITPAFPGMMISSMIERRIFDSGQPSAGQFECWLSGGRLQE
jgi:hypothetical protein